MKNKLFKNKRIHASFNQDANYDNGYVALTVSPYDSDFEKELEPGVRSHCLALFNKGYYPISSCEGHYFKNTHMNWYIMLAFGGDDNKQIRRRINKFIKQIEHVKGLYCEIRKQTANTNEQELKVVKLTDVKKEYDYMNKLFMKKHKLYQYLYIGLFKESSLANAFGRALYFNKSKNQLLDIFVWELENEYIY